VIESLAVEDDGSAVLTVGVDRRENEFRLSGGELERLEDELAATDLGDVDKEPAGTICADCFEYSISYEGESVSLDDLDRPGASLRALLDYLGELVRENYPPGVPPAQLGA
jgi:hypothetical protein